MLATMTEMDSAWAIAVGDAIRRELGHRPQRWLAAATSIDPATISRFIQGKQLPTLDHLDAMARALDTTRRQLLMAAGYVEPEQGLDVDTLPPWARRSIRALLRQVDQDRSVESVVRNDSDGS